MDKVDEIAALLSEAAETHAMVFRITDGEDPDSASWFAKWLIELSELPDVLGEEPIRSHLIYELVRLEREYAEIETDEPWEMYYAAQLLEEFGVTEEELEKEDEEEDDDDELEDEAEDDGIITFTYEGADESVHS